MLSDENEKKVLNENSKNIQGFSKIGLHNVNRKNSKIFNGCELMKLWANQFRFDNGMKLLLLGAYTRLSLNVI